MEVKRYEFIFRIFGTGKTQGEAPKFTQPLESVEVTEGNGATLECKVAGTPEPNIAWFKDGKSVAEVKRYKTRFDGERATLKITTTELDDEGQYKCVAENMFGSASCSSELLVNEANVKPAFEEKMKPVDVTEGEPAQFSVKVTGHPSPVIDWYRGKDKLEDQGRIEMVDNEDSGTYSLTINDTLPEDAGAYKCVAENEEGQVSCKAALAVREVITEPVFDTEQEAAPVKVGEGDVVSLNTVVKGKPEPAVDWYKDEEKLQETSRLKMDAKDGEHSLIILEAKPEDSGVYKCEAKSKGGKAEKTFDVDVKGALFHARCFKNLSSSLRVLIALFHF